MMQVELRNPRPTSAACPFKNDAEYPGLAMSVDGKRSSVTESNRALIAPCTAMVKPSPLLRASSDHVNTDRRLVCTYDKPSNRRRNPAPQYVEALEAKLQRTEALLRKYMPNVDLNDPNLDPLVQREFRNRERTRVKPAQATKVQAPTTSDGGEGLSTSIDAQDAQILSMIETIGQLDLGEAGEWDFHGISSSAVFLRRMKEHFRGMLGTDYRLPFLPRPPRPPGMFSLDSPRSSAGSQWDVSALPNIYDLPPKERAKTLCYYSLSCATCLLRVVHTPTFYEMLDRLYATPVESWGSEENRFLGLLYSVMALACMYTVPDDISSGRPGTHKMAMEEG
jgi:hypothetical protein